MSTSVSGLAVGVEVGLGDGAIMVSGIGNTMIMVGRGTRVAEGETWTVSTVTAGFVGGGVVP